MYKKLIVIAAVAAILGGCKNNGADVPSTPSVGDITSDTHQEVSAEATPQDDQLAPDDHALDSAKVEIKHYPWNMVTDVCPYDDLGLDYHDINNIESLDIAPQTCLDGKHYCYAADSRPIVQPDSPDGWKCQIVHKLPSHIAIPDEYYQYTPEYLFYMNTHMIRKRVNWQFMRAWVCTKDECMCGENTCPENGLCIDGTCYCNDVLYQNGKCDLYKNNVEPDRYTDKEEDINTYFKTYYIDDPYFSENKTFWIEDIRAERDKNRGDKNYSCGKETCVKGEVCLKNHCVSPATRKKLPDDDYTWDSFIPKCMYESGCACGKDHCYYGDSCFDGECKESPFYQKVGKKWVYYQVMHSMIREGQAKLENPNNGVWLDILTHSKSKACDNHPIPANSDEYVCIFELRDAENDQEFLSARGFYCNEPNGCTCGKNKCPLYAQCIDGSCAYDAVYLELACNRKGILLQPQRDRVSNHYVDQNGWCYCGESLVPPNLSGYVCNDCLSGEECQKQESMKCVSDKGCSCGNVKCNKDEYCITPGTCKK